MIRLSANLSKKMPLPGIDYSSLQFGASLEIEVSDKDQPEAIRQRIAELYGLLSEAVDEQMAQAGVSAQPRTRYAPRNGHSTPARGNGYRSGTATARSNGNGRRATPATAAQCRAIASICNSLGLNVADALAEYRVDDPADLTVRDASAVIDDLKSRQAPPPARR